MKLFSRTIKALRFFFSFVPFSSLSKAFVKKSAFCLFQSVLFVACFASVSLVAALVSLLVSVESDQYDLTKTRRKRKTTSSSQREQACDRSGKLASGLVTTLKKITPPSSFAHINERGGERACLSRKIYVKGSPRLFNQIRLISFCLSRTLLSPSESLSLSLLLVRSLLPFLYKYIYSSLNNIESISRSLNVFFLTLCHFSCLSLFLFLSLSLALSFSL